jgi:hypothetical protein
MTINLRALMGAALISTGFALAGISGARADDEYGTNRSPTILSSAQSVRYANPADTPLARATAQARSATSAIASTAHSVPVTGAIDLVGQGGQQDEIARETYHPGSGTDW